MSKLSICAVVVTYNRKDLLLECLSALEEQEYPVSHIVVVNNASTDGTIDLLTQCGWLDKPYFTLIKLEENQGGAGGFYTGIEFAYQKNFDYIWLMDDDGLAHKDCLKNLSKYFSEKCYIGPIVLDIKNKEKLSFSLRMANKTKVIDRYSDIPSELLNRNIIKDVILPFNGTLISRKLINHIGLPCKEYFIWGDEREYTMRAIKENADLFTVINAIFYHPADSSSSIPMFFGKLRFNNADSKLKQYCFCRNSIALFKKHRGYLYVLAFWIKTTWFFIFTKPSLKKLLFSWKAMLHGIKGDFSHHKEYL